MESLSQHIESLIFTSQGPITFDEIRAALEDSFDTKFKKADLKTAIQGILDKYKSEDFAFEIVEIANGYQFFTKGAYHQTVGSRLKLTSKKRLSKAALETLAVIAYKQPVVKSELEKIRGVSCDYTVQKLLEKELISIMGRSENPGRPLLYGTSQKFMDYFGLKDLTELPKPKDFKLPEDEIGTAAPIEELTEEQRAKRSSALEDLVDEVASAIMGEEVLPMSFDGVLEEDSSEEEIVEGENIAGDSNTEEAAAGKELTDGASTAPGQGQIDEDSEAEETGEKENVYYRSDTNPISPEQLGGMVAPMSAEEMAALAGEDALLEPEEEEGLDVENENEETVEELDEKIENLELEEELPVVEEEMVSNSFENEVDAIATIVGLLERSESQEEKAENVVVTEELEDKTLEESVLESFEEEVDAVAAVVGLLEKSGSQEEKVENVVVTEEFEEEVLKETVTDSFEEEVDAIATVVGLLERRSKSEEEKVKDVVVTEEFEEKILEETAPGSFEDEVDAIAAMVRLLPENERINIHKTETENIVVEEKEEERIIEEFSFEDKPNLIEVPTGLILKNSEALLEEEVVEETVVKQQPEEKREEKFSINEEVAAIAAMIGLLPEWTEAEKVIEEKEVVFESEETELIAFNVDVDDVDEEELVLRDEEMVGQIEEDLAEMRQEVELAETELITSFEGDEERALEDEEIFSEEATADAIADMQGALSKWDAIEKGELKAVVVEQEIEVEIAEEDIKEGDDIIEYVETIDDVLEETARETISEDELLKDVEGEELSIKEDEIEDQEDLSKKKLN